MKNILVKCSGDLSGSKEFFDFVVEKVRGNYVVVICGGGTKISAALKAAGYEVAFDELNRRITKTQEEQFIARGVLLEEAKNLQAKFAGKAVDVVPSFIYAGEVFCPINGDDLVKAYELGFDEIYVLTKQERVWKKELVFKNFPKVKIIGI